MLQIRQFLTTYLKRDHAAAADQLTTLLGRLAAADLPPDEFSFSDEPDHPAAHVPYSETQLREYILSTPGMLTPRFQRHRAPTFVLAPGFIDEELPYTSLMWKFPDSDRTATAELFLAASHLGDLTQPLFGGVGFPWADTTEEARRFNAMLNTGGLDLHNNGPDSAAVRSWFGPPFAAQLDPAALTALDLVVRTTDWGGLEVDLTDEPWNAPLELLAAQKQAFNGYLSDLGLLGDYSRRLLRRPGARWAQVKAHLP